MKTLASLNPSASRAAEINQQTAARKTAANAQTILANRLAEKLGLPPGSLNGKQDDFTPEKVANRILGFIEQRLQGEAVAGADPAKLQKLLGQAREGVEKGFEEARKILDGMGGLAGKVASDIDDTYQRIQDGLAGLDQRFGAGAPAAGQVAAAGYSQRLAAQAETFDLSVTTRDGDRLRISVAQASASWSQTRFAGVGAGGGGALAASRESGSLLTGAWQVGVEGELDEQEVEALERLFSQVQDLSNKFYAGDLAGAFDRAMDLQMDGEQLASMSLRLTQTSVRQATDVYGAVAGQGGQAASAVSPSLQEYAQGLLEALHGAGDLARDAKGLLTDLLKGGFSLDERFDPPRLEKAERLNRSLLDGLHNLLPGQPDESATLS
ncbi:DUF5610 domain-containing protein [Pseudomonas sp. SP16.1]|uniref:DUF5610 domain-containing protein n=1 Tax=Pseudomonas sp. SP16.1 TaxID=3458854 RepID=UPI0040454EF5